jgi:hypothetical protein
MAPPRTVQPDDLFSQVVALAEQIRALQTSDSVGFAATKGTTRWQDSSGVDRVVIGVQADGSIAVKVGNATFYATGANAGAILGLVSETLSGLLTAQGGLSTGQNSFHVFTGASDPAASAAEGDIWING